MRWWLILVLDSLGKQRARIFGNASSWWRKIARIKYFAIKKRKKKDMGISFCLDSYGESWKRDKYLGIGLWEGRLSLYRCPSEVWYQLDDIGEGNHLFINCPWRVFDAIIVTYYLDTEKECLVGATIKRYQLVMVWRRFMIGLEGLVTTFNMNELHQILS